MSLLKFSDVLTLNTFLDKEIFNLGIFSLKSMLSWSLIGVKNMNIL